MKNIIIISALIVGGIYLYKNREKLPKTCNCQSGKTDVEPKNTSPDCNSIVNDRMMNMRFISAQALNNYKADAIKKCENSTNSGFIGDPNW